MVKRWLVLAILTIMVLTMAVGLAKDEQTPYVIGAFCSVTGPNAPLGTPERDTLLLIADKVNQNGGINGHPLKIIIEDDASDTTSAVKAAKKLIEQDQVAAIIGGSGTGPTMAVVPITEESGVPHISMAAGTIQPVRKWVFRSPQTAEMAISRILDYLTHKKIKQVAIIYDSNAFGTDGRDLLRKLAPGYGVKVLAEEAFGSKDTDMTVQLTKIRSTGAKAIICWGTNPGPAQVAKNIQQLGIKIPLLMSHGVANQTFLDLAGPAAEGIVLPVGKLMVAKELSNKDRQKKLLLEYAAEFQSRYNRPADTFGGHAWDALQIIIRALEKAGDDRAKLRDEIEKTTDFVGIGGVFNYSPDNHDGLTKDAFVMAKVKKGKWTMVKD